MSKHSLSTSSFKTNVKFFIKLIIFFVCFLAYLNHIMPQYEGQYTASLVDKVERLESIDEPKIVLIGNSNLAFGIDSELIEKEFSMPVVNMGLHGSLGNAFHEEMAKLNVTEGDIYIICHSSYEDYDVILDPTLAWITLENHFDLWKLLRPKDIDPMFKAFPIYVKKCLPLYAQNQGNVDNGDVYARSSANKYGDVAVPRLGSVYVFENEVKPSIISQEAVGRINELNEWLNNKGATLLVAGYPIGNGKLTADKKDFEKFQQELEEALDCEVISDFTDYMYDYKYFYNTHLHLNTEGVDLRTKQLIEDIKNWEKRK